MVSARATAVILMPCLLLSACARWEFSEDQHMRGEEVGLKTWPPKPYLLVSRTGNKDKPVEISVVYLPDLAHPVYVKPRTGYGSANLTIALTNGMVTSVGQTTDTKIPETITALGSFASSATSLAKTLAAQGATDYRQTSANLASIAGGLRQQIGMAASSNLLTPIELQVASSIAAVVRQDAALLADPKRVQGNIAGVIASLQNALKNWENIQPASNGTEGPEPQVRRNLSVLKDQLAKELARLNPTSAAGDAAQPALELYEFDNSGPATVLKRVGAT